MAKPVGYFNVTLDYGMNFGILKENHDVFDVKTY
jgi:hypothetical protein